MHSVTHPILLIGLLLALPPVLVGQTPQELLERIDQLEQEMKVRQEAFEERLRAVENQRDDLQTQVESLTGLEEQIQTQLQEEIEGALRDRIKFYQRPSLVNDQRPLFEAIQGGLIMTGLFRSRIDYRHNNQDFNDDEDDSGVRMSGRFRLGFGATITDDRPNGPRINALTEFQVYGKFNNNSFYSTAAEGSLPDEGSLILEPPFEQVRLYQGYIDFKELFAPELRLVVGRQELAFGTEFILGNEDFFGGRTHDGLLLEWKSEALSLSGLVTAEAQRDFDIAPPPEGNEDFDYDWMAGIYGEYEATTDLRFDAYVLHFEARSSIENVDILQTATGPAFDSSFFDALTGSFWTVGARGFLGRVKVGDGFMAFNAELAYQFGADGDADISGLSGEFLFNWWFDAPGSDGWNPILTLGYYYCEGGNRDGSRMGFQPMFINRHFEVVDRNDPSRPYYAGGGRYGNMDLVPLSNIHMFRSALTVAPSEDIELGVGYLLAIVADDQGLGTGVLGHEIDLFGSYRYHYAEGRGKGTIIFGANLSVFFPGDGASDLSQFLFAREISSGVLGQIAGDDIAYAVYIQALLSF